jgi:hypothetical protein
MDISTYGLMGAEMAGLVIFTSYLVWRYASKDVHFHTLLPVFGTWFLCFSIVGIVPIDIFYVSPRNLMQDLLEFVFL